MGEVGVGDGDCAALDVATVAEALALLGLETAAASKFDDFGGD